MGVTPARHQREQARIEREKDEGRKQNEAKFTEFDMGCSAGQVSACNSLGEWHSLMKQDFRKAAELYSTACLQHSYPQACLNLGHMLMHGKGDVAPHPSGALRAFSIACESGNADACSNAGRMLLQLAVTGSLVEPNSRDEVGKADVAEPATALPSAVETAERYFRIGCVSGDSTTNAKCCGMLAALHTSPRFSTTPGITRAEPGHVLALLHTACTGEYAPACMKLGTLYRKGRVQDLGVEVEVDEAKADALDKQGLRWMGMSESRAQREIERQKAKGNSLR